MKTAKTYGTGCAKASRDAEPRLSKAERRPATALATSWLSPYAAVHASLPVRAAAESVRGWGRQPMVEEPLVAGHFVDIGS